MSEEFQLECLGERSSKVSPSSKSSAFVSQPNPPSFSFLERMPAMTIDTLAQDCFPDDDQEDALLLAEANNDEDVRLHGCRTVEELAYRLDQLSEELLLLETDPILQIVAFTGETPHPFFHPHPLKRDRDVDLQYKITEYSRFAACRDRVFLRRALEAGYPELPSCILKPGELSFPEADIQAAMCIARNMIASLNTRTSQVIQKSAAISPSIPTSSPLPIFEPVAVTSLPRCTSSGSHCESSPISSPLGLDLNVGGLNMPAGEDARTALGLNKPPTRRPSVQRRSSLIARVATIHTHAAGPSSSVANSAHALPPTSCGDLTSHTLPSPSTKQVSNSTSFSGRPGPCVPSPHVSMFSCLLPAESGSATTESEAEVDPSGVLAATAILSAPPCACLANAPRVPGSLLLGGSAAAHHHILLEQQGVRLVLNAARVSDRSPAHVTHTSELATRGIAHVQLDWLDHHTQLINATELAQCLRAMHLARYVPLSCYCHTHTHAHTGAALAGQVVDSTFPRAPADALPIRCASVLVHCAQGRSRSATVVTAYVAAVTKVPIAVALALVQGRRSIASPNLGFQRRLLALEQEGFFHAMHAELQAITPGSPVSSAPSSALMLSSAQPHETRFVKQYVALPSQLSLPKPSTSVDSCTRASLCDSDGGDDESLLVTLDLTLSIDPLPPPPARVDMLPVSGQNLPVQPRASPPAVTCGARLDNCSDEDTQIDTLSMDLPSPRSHSSPPHDTPPPKVTVIATRGTSIATSDTPALRGDARGVLLDASVGPQPTPDFGADSGATMTPTPLCRANSSIAAPCTFAQSSTAPIAHATSTSSISLSPMASSSAVAPLSHPPPSVPTPRLRLRMPRPPPALPPSAMATVPVATATAPLSVKSTSIARSPTGVIRVRTQGVDNAKVSPRALLDNILNP